ncbi:MAG: S8 family serine peptidase [Mycolicibacterium neoaurum]|nr:S8 family serine peptidase [Mycolicibacterium neoaurum]
MAAGAWASTTAPSGHKVVVDAKALAVQAELSRGGATRLVDYRSFSLWRVPGPIGAELLSRVTVRDDFNTIPLRGTVIDTGSAAPAVPIELRQVRANGGQFWLVQFVGPVKDEWLAELRSIGLEPVIYMPYNAYVVFGGGSSLARLDQSAPASPVIQWVGEYHPAYRLAPELLGAARDLPAGQMVDVTVQLLTGKGTEQSLTALQQVGGALRRNVSRVLGFTNISLQLPAGQLTAVANWPDVFNVEPWVAPRKNDEVQGQILAGNITTSGGNIVPSGTGYLAWLASKGFPTTPASYPVVAIVDDGFDNGTTSPLHPDFHELGLLANPSRVGFVGNCTTDASGNGVAGHGNLNTGIVGSYNDLAGSPHQDANSYRIGLGMSPYGRMSTTKVFTNAGSYSDTACGGTNAGVVGNAVTGGAGLTSNSWGAPVGGSYNVDSQDFDALTRDSVGGTPGNQEMLHVFSAGNSGSSANTIGSPGTAKNVFTVGATENVRDNGTSDGCGEPAANNADDCAGFSSRGPTDDGRIKPDITAPGTHVQGPASQDPGFSGAGVCGGPTNDFAFPPADAYYPAGQTLYTWSSGTSHSCPAVAGAASLTWNYFNTVLSPGNTASPAMLKALLVNSARYLNGLSTGGNLPHNSQGWGDVNLGTLTDGAARFLVDQTVTFGATGNDQVFTGTVADTGLPLRVTLVWTDAPGSTTGNAYVNDLNLEVTAGGVTYLGNVFSGAFSAAGGTADPRNNIEGVFLPTGTSGPVTVRIVAANVPGDGVPGNADTTDQDFALVIYNFNQALIPVMQSGAAAQTAEDLCAPANGVPDPDEVVTIDFTIRNIGAAATVNAVGTLLATGGVTTPDGPYTYGAIPIGGSATQSFTFRVDPAASCGGTVTASMQIQDGAEDLGTVTWTIGLGVASAGPPVTTSYTGPAVAIPDNNATGVTANLPVSGVTGIVGNVVFSFDRNPAGSCSAAIGDVNVGLDHTWVGDLIVSLTSPAGTTVVLASRPGGSGNSGNNFCDTVLDDAGATGIQAITAGGNPYTGTFSPNSPLSAFDGEDPNGTWVLAVSDNAGQDTGSIRRFSVTITPTLYSCCIPYPVELMTFQVQ